MSMADRTCRTCGKASESKDDPNLYPLYNYKSQIYEAEIKIIMEEFQIWNLNISKHDGLPQQICATCFDSFCQVHNFRVLCIEAQLKFAEMCTGLDIYINEDMAEENYDFLNNCKIHEHFAFPVDECQTANDTQADPKNPSDKASSSDKEEQTNEKALADPNEDNSSDNPDEVILELKTYRCEFCMNIVSFDDPDQLNDHYNKLHSSNLPFTCPKCEKCFDSKAKRNSHARVHYQMVDKCKQCGKKVRGGKEMMWQHLELNHVQKDRKCPKCGKEFQMISMRRLNYHLYWHDDSKLHKCKYCDKKFIQTTHLVIHERNHTGECPYKCNQCGSRFKNQSLLRTHIQVHGEKRHICPHCSKKFSHHSGLKAHIRIHDTGSKKFHCDACKKDYQSLVNLQMHNYKHHGAPATRSLLTILKSRNQTKPNIKPFKCNECPLKFVLHTELVKHLKTHKEIRPFSCNICHKTFKRATHLKIHTNSLHLNKKPYKCSICGWAFPQKYNLNEHIASKHGDKREFECSVCPKAFATFKSLKTHMIKHSEKKPYICTVCDKGFKQLIVLKTHMTRHLRNNEVDTTGGIITDIQLEEEDLEESDDI